MIGKIVIIDDSRYRIIGYQEGVFSLIKMDTHKFIMLYAHDEELRQKLRNGIWKEFIEEPLVVDMTQLSEKEKESFLTKKSIVNRVCDVYGPMFEDLGSKRRKPDIDKLVGESIYSRATIRNIIRDYLQAGMNNASLINKNLITNNRPNASYNYTQRTGRKATVGLPCTVIVTDEVKKQFDAAIQQYRSGKEVTLIHAFSWMRDTYYAKKLPNGELLRVPETDTPTFDQFYYYYSKVVSKEERDIIKTSIHEQRNSKRLLFSSSRTDAIRPGWILEVDALEADVSIVNPDTSTYIGRPVVYFAIDVKTSVIVAASVSLENNSIIGLTNLMINLADDKQTLAESYGICFDPYLWPSNFIPHEIRCDRGSDFKSDPIAEICRNLGVTRTLEPGATGSMKGLVEQSFHMFQASFRPSLKGYGLITKDYNSDHKETAVLTLEDFIKLTYTFVISHNQNPLKDYPRDRAMIAAGVQTAPCALWEYYCKECGAPQPITQSGLDHYWYNIMLDATVTMSRRGITYKDLHYINSDPELRVQMYNLGTKTMKMNVHYDPRDVGTLYYLRDGHLEQLKLNPDIPGNADFDGLTWAEYGEYLKKKKELKKQGKVINLEIMSFRSRAYFSIAADAASHSHFKPSTHNVRENRDVIKQTSNYNNRIASHLPVSSVPALPEPQLIKAPVAQLLSGEEKVAAPSVPDDMTDEEAIALFY